MRSVTVAACLLAGCAKPAPTITLPAGPPMIQAPVAPAQVVTILPDEPGPEFWDQELAWARSRFPVLRDFALDVDFRPLLDWVPVGKMVMLFLRGEYTLSSGNEIRYECATAEATRFESADGEIGLGLLIPGPERVENGETIRDYLSGVAGIDGVALGYRGKQRRHRDGTWEKFDGYSAGYLQFGARVGPVDHDTAHFRYVKVEPRASCGPLVELPCDDGIRRGHNVCNACETVALELVWSNWPLSSLPPTVRQCDVACPVVENPELERIQRLIEHFPTGFVPDREHLGVALYRTRAACETDPLWRTP